MIPYRDENPSRAVPIVTIAIIVFSGWVFFQELKLSRLALHQAFNRYGLIPTQVTHPGSLAGVRAAAAASVTSLFMHAGLWHFVGNMWFLWVFGDNVEARLGRVRFLALYLLCGIAGGLAHVLLNYNAAKPCIGASGAIAGVLGAYFVLFPSARIRAIIPIFVIVPLFVSLPAVIFIGFWFAMQLMNGMAAVGPQGAATGTAWWAHIGGFMAGIFLLILLRPRSRRTRDSSGYPTYRG